MVKLKKPHSSRTPATTASGSKRIAVYTGSFDPPTLGHYDVIQRASLLFDELIVAIGEAQAKSALFPVQGRVQILREICGAIANVRIATFSGLAVDFALSQHAVVLIRGLRSSIDYNYEMQMALMNRAMAPSLETVFIPTSPQFSHISSSLAKEIALHGGDVNLLVPPAVTRRLREKLKNP